MNKLLKGIVWTLILSVTLGFRISPGKWNVSKADPTVWIKLCASTWTIQDNDLPDGDVLAGVSGITFSQVLQSVIDDYNNIPTSYLRLALYPTDPNNPGTALPGDSTFTTQKAEARTIEICFGSTDPRAGASGGYAMPNVVGNQMISCEIRAAEGHLKKAKFLTHLLTHELGHCFALQHPQEATESTMSYFGSLEKKVRLQNDDKAGITYRYPEDDQYAKEVATYGLTGCSPRNN